MIIPSPDQEPRDLDFPEIRKALYEFEHTHLADMFYAEINGEIGASDEIHATTPVAYVSGSWNVSPSTKKAELLKVLNGWASGLAGSGRNVLIWRLHPQLTPIDDSDWVRVRMRLAAVPLDDLSTIGRFKVNSCQITEKSEKNDQYAGEHSTQNDIREWLAQAERLPNQ